MTERRAEDTKATSRNPRDGSTTPAAVASDLRVTTEIDRGDANCDGILDLVTDATAVPRIAKGLLPAKGGHVRELAGAVAAPETGIHAFDRGRAERRLLRLVAGWLLLTASLGGSAAGQAGDGVRMVGREDAGVSPRDVPGLNRDEVLWPTFRAELNGGVVVAGCGLRGTGPPEAEGTITIAGIPSDATVVKAILNWTLMGGMRPSPLANLEPPGGPPLTVEGTFLGQDISPCWLLPFIYGFSADVCDALTADGNGVYTVRLPDSGVLTDHPSAEGAALVVIYESPSSPRRDIVVYEGLETQDGGATTQTIVGFDASSPLDFAEVTFVVSDGQGGSNDPAAGRALVNGRVVIEPYFDGDEAASCTAIDPRYFDVDTVDVAGIVRAGDTSLTATVESPDELGLVDCLTWSALVVSIATETAPGLPAACPRPCPRLAYAAAGPDTEICLGQTSTLDASGSAGCAAAEYRYRWREGAGVLCDWSDVPSCEVSPTATTTYTLDVSCESDLACATSNEVTVLVDQDRLPPDLDNTLRAVRVDRNVLLTWREEPLARTYSLHRSETKSVWPVTPYHASLTLAADVDINAVPAPLNLFFYRVAGAACSGREGP